MVGGRRDSSAGLWEAAGEQTGWEEVEGGRKKPWSTEAGLVERGERETVLFRSDRLEFVWEDRGKAAWLRLRIKISIEL